ncbi:4-(cytidine 5'-diphospho)-2-C-methyl-D-erythritol kinase [Roseovarius albus]|nr:4-(cytidine 5'-diphospho)-2-C-methyl-D-erythritol kinase [Roseovarius albus]
MTTIEAFAPAKINLTLHVTDRRADGYHLLDSLVVFAGIGDRLILKSSDTTELEVSGPFAGGVPTDNRNLVKKAAKLMGATATINLEKNLPHAAGIGGGSSDAAATIKALSLLNSLSLPNGAAVLGADIPVCLAAQAARMRGIGEIIEPLPDFPILHGVLANPRLPIETKTIFANLKSPQNSAMPSSLPAFDTSDDCITFLQTMRNDLEAPAIKAQPVIEDVLHALTQTASCRLARMSGSGATCFGLYADEITAKIAARDLQRTHPNWWVTATTLN